VKIRIVCVGKIRERFFRDAVSEYVKRLSRYARVSIEEVADEKTPDGAAAGENASILTQEGGRILSRLSPSDHVIALAIRGTPCTSEAFASHLGGMMTNGVSSITFVIGGSLGLDPRVLARADEQLSFSSFTFPHPLMRVILCEQIYRAFRIIRHEPYHK